MLMSNLTLINDKQNISKWSLIIPIDALGDIVNCCDDFDELKVLMCFTGHGEGFNFSKTYIKNKTKISNVDKVVEAINRLMEKGFISIYSDDNSQWYVQVNWPAILNNRILAEKKLQDLIDKYGFENEDINTLQDLLKK